ncbi:SsgA family sporulation/cell division regulator [Streptomyces sp. TS71-3]|uniref:SsgA family sporulation/cell division regulator n=1 Tax=Streptomyces sp. TS71-3 TaxID=2733862 RepID=UPI001B212C0B|nr:SsgA family sporulation/cell division regulator [Streptomyces sp. TS71-3]GHJ42386.1 hypothetical protein Sm713_79950 [Streptomyces sp. TS71-3]
MPGIVQKSTDARLIASRLRRSVPVTLRYEEADPLAVHLGFPSEATLDETPITWTFSRDLLERGLAAPAGRGDVHIWPGGPERTVIEFDAPQGRALVEFDETSLRRFLGRTEEAVPPGEEDVTGEVDRGLAEILGSGEGSTPSP